MPDLSDVVVTRHGGSDPGQLRLVRYLGFQKSADSVNCPRITSSHVTGELMIIRGMLHMERSNDVLRDRAYLTK